MEDIKTQKQESKDINDIKLSINDNDNANNKENEINENQKKEQQKNQIIENFEDEIPAKENEEQLSNINNTNQILNQNLYDDKNDSSNDIIKLDQDNSKQSLKNKMINTERLSAIKFIKDEKPDSTQGINSSNNNLYYLGNLFNDVINKYDIENKEEDEPRQFLEKSRIHRKTICDNRNVPQR